MTFDNKEKKVADQGGMPNESEIDLAPSDEDDSQNEFDEEVKPPSKIEPAKDEKSTTATSKT